MSKLNETIDYIVASLSAAGQPCTYQQLNNLLFCLQGWSLRLTGHAASSESIAVKPGGPQILDQSFGGTKPSTQVLQPPSVTPSLGGRETLVNAVLRAHASNPYALHGWIVTSPLWAYSQSTENKVHPDNLKAFFAKLPALPVHPEAHPKVTAWPYSYAPFDEAAENARARAEHLAKEARR